MVKGCDTVINFVICDDEKVLTKKYSTIIEKFMMKYDTEYKIHIFEGYTDEWKKFALKDEGFKVYLLDIKTDTGSGLDAARLIREEYDDWVSMIIIVTAFSQYRYEALGKRLMLVDFINKIDNCNDRLKSDLEICIKNYDNRKKVLRYNYKNTIYNIELRQILFIEKEPDSKRCLIATTYGEFFIPGTLNQVLKKLDKRFIKCSRSAAINTEQIGNYDYKKNIIIFKNNREYDKASREGRKDVIRYVRGLY